MARQGGGPHVAHRPLQRIGPQRGNFANSLRRPGRIAQSEGPKRVGGALLPFPKAQRLAAEHPRALLPTSLIAPARCGRRFCVTVARQMDDHGGRGVLGGPGGYAGCTGHHVHGSAVVESAGKCGACVEAVSLVKKGTRAAAGIDVRLEHGDVHAGAGQRGRHGETAYARADDNRSICFRHATRSLPAHGSMRIIGSGLHAGRRRAPTPAGGRARGSRGRLRRPRAPRRAGMRQRPTGTASSHS